MRVLVLPNALKGSLSARRAGQAIARTLQAQHTVRMFPLSDGGDGFIDTFLALDPHARLIKTRAKNAFLNTKTTSFLLLSDKKTAVVETARICGLGSVANGPLDPLGASSYGVGQVLLQAVKHGARKIYVGLGGVACNDGGAGAAIACGARLLDQKGRALACGAQALLQLEKMDLSPLKKQFKGVQVIGVADVTNPLLGTLGSARVFGPQKGASPVQVKTLERALARWAHVLKQTTAKDISKLPSCGAAGAIAAGLAAIWKAPLVLGADFLAQKATLEKQVQWADLIITCEGKLDAQTFYGKAPAAVLKRAHKYQKPVVFICGSADWKALAKQKLAHVCVAELIDFAPSLEQAQQHASRYLTKICKNLR